MRSNIAPRIGWGLFWTLIVALNLAVAIPAGASDWENDVCYEGGVAVPCCTVCFFFCECDDIIVR